MEPTIPKIRGKASLYRSIGIIGSASTLALSSIWIILCIFAITYFLAGAPYNENRDLNILSPFGLSFAIAYFNKDLAHYTESYLTPLTVCLLITLYLLLSINLLVASVLTFKEFRNWMETTLIKRRSAYWSASAIVMGVYELIFAILFFTDYAKCSMTPHGDYVGAAAITMATIAMKGYLMWAFYMALSLTLFHIHYFNKDYCPV